MTESWATDRAFVAHSVRYGQPIRVWTEHEPTTKHIPRRLTGLSCDREWMVQ